MKEIILKLTDKEFKKLMELKREIKIKKDYSWLEFFIRIARFYKKYGLNKGLK